MKKICGLTPDELASELEADGMDGSLGLKLAYWIYKKRVTDISAISNISKGIKEKLSDKYETGIYYPVQTVVSVDKTEKYLYITSDGRKFEAVYIPETKRKTLCVSSQAGCRMGCSFCLTGKSGFKGNLDEGEIVNQIVSNPHAGEITKVVFMGMGEPMDNLQQVLRACEIMTAQWGLALGVSNVTVSTVGIKSMVVDFLERSGCNLTLSLHSPFSEERLRVIPSESLSPSIEIIEIIKRVTGVKRRISVAYIMIDGINDTDIHLEKLIEIIRGTGIRVNLIPFNKTQDNSWTSSTDERMILFKHILVKSGISASIRKSRGIDIGAACGQLACSQ